MKITLRQAWTTLGIAEGASEDVARSAYRKLALQFHPDKNPHAEATAKFQEISAAYKKICDFHKRGGNQNLFYDDDSEGDEDHFEHDFGFGDMDLDDLEPTFEEMLLMFEMMFGPTTGRGTKTKKKRTTKKPTAVATKTTKTSSQDSTATPEPPAKASVPLGPTTRVGKARRRKAPLGKQRGRGGLDDPFTGFLDPEMMMFEQFMGMSMNDPDLDGMDHDLMEEMMHLFASASDDDLFEAVGGRGRRKAKGKTKVKKATARAMSSEEEIEEVSDWEDIEEKAPADQQGNQCDEKQPHDALAINNRVLVHGRLHGTIKFVGSVHYTKGDFIGVELDEPEGKNDGTIKGIAYFTCKPRHGVMVRPHEITLAPPSRT